MKSKFNNKYFRIGLTAFLVIAASIAFYYLVFHGSALKANLKALWNIMMPIVFGLGTAYLLTPVLNFVEGRLLLPFCSKCRIKESRRRNKILRGISVIITSVLIFSLLYAMIAMLLSQIVPSIQNIVSNFDTYLNNFTVWINNLLANNADIKDYVLRNIDKYSVELENWLNNEVLSKSSALIKTVSLSVIGMLKILWNFIIGFVIAVYVLFIKETLAGQAKKLIYAVFEKNTANIVLNNFRFTHKTFIGFVGGKILDSIIIGILCFICTTIMGTPYAALVSLIIGVTNVIPFFGPFLGAIPTTVLIFVVDPVHPLNCLYFVIFILILQQFDGNILGPKILGNSTGITGFWVLFSITLFGGLFGVLGMIVGVPIFAVIYATIRAFVNNALRKKSLPEDTSLYLELGRIDDAGFHKYVPANKHTSSKRKRAGQENQTKATEDWSQNPEESSRACFGERFYSSVEDIDLDLKFQKTKKTKCEKMTEEVNAKKAEE